jgi:tetratricopeptide (TPR) repeat protein
VARLEQALERLSSEDLDEDVAEVAGQFGRFLTLSGRHDEALVQLERALALAETLDLPEVFVQVLISKGSALGRLGRIKESEILLSAALERALAEDILAAGQRAANNLAYQLETRDAFVESEVVSARGVELARRIGDRRMESFIRAGALSGDIALGRWDNAIAIADEIDPREAYGSQTALVVEVECRRGRVKEARERLGRYTAALGADDPQIRTTYVVAEATVLRAEGRPRQALETIEQGLTEGLDRVGIGSIAVKMLLIEALECAYELSDGAKLEELLGRIEVLQPGERSPLLAAHAARFRAKLETDASRAEAGFRRAETTFREIGLVFPLAVTQLEHAERLAAVGRSTDAQPLLEGARETFERLEALPWLERALEIGSEGYLQTTGSAAT